MTTDLLINKLFEDGMGHLNTLYMFLFLEILFIPVRSKSLVCMVCYPNILRNSTSHFSIQPIAVFIVFVTIGGHVSRVLRFICVHLLDIVKCI